MKPSLQDCRHLSGPQVHPTTARDGAHAWGQGLGRRPGPGARRRRRPAPAPPGASGRDGSSSTSGREPAETAPLQPSSPLPQRVRRCVRPARLSSPAPPLAGARAPLARRPAPWARAPCAPAGPGSAPGMCRDLSSLPRVSAVGWVPCDLRTALSLAAH